MKVSLSLRLLPIQIGIFPIIHINVERVLQDQIQESKRVLDEAIDDTIYRRDHSKRIELNTWVLDNLKNPDIITCKIIETKMNEITDKINRTHNVFEPDPLHCKYMILEHILHQVFSNEIKSLKGYNIR
ncbi:hypothetical protein BH18THE1_BH18THE1_10560 [soil metagenome]